MALTAGEDKLSLPALLYSCAQKSLHTGLSVCPDLLELVYSHKARSVSRFQILEYLFECSHRGTYLAQTYIQAWLPRQCIQLESYTH